MRSAVQDGSVIELGGSAQDLLARVNELRARGWTVAVRGTRLTPSCDVVWSLAVRRVDC